MANNPTLTEAAILDRVICPEVADLNPDAARTLLRFTFDRDTTKQIRRLLRKNNRGSISGEERVALEKYLRVGQFLDLLHAKAKLSIHRNRTQR